MVFPDFEKFTLLSDTVTYCTSSTTDTPKLGNYSTNTTTISTPKSREQAAIFKLNKELECIRNRD